MPQLVCIMFLSQPLRICEALGRCYIIVVLLAGPRMEWRTP